MRRSSAGPSDKAAIAILFGVALFVTAPALLFDRMLSGDTHIHVRWQYHFAAQFWAGDVYPRWLSGLNDGFGSPAFFIYPPLGQWSAALLDPLLPGAEYASSRIAMLLFLYASIGGMGLWRWVGGLIADRPAALLAGAVYIVLPYHAYLDAYQRGAIAELVAMGVAPWIFAGIDRLRSTRGGWRGAPMTMLAVAALLLSNAPSAVAFGLFAAAYGLFRAIGDRDAALALRGIVCALTGVAMAGAYLATALTMTPLIKYWLLFDGQYQPLNYLFGGRPWPDRGIYLAIAMMVAVHVPLTVALVAAGWRHERARPLIATLAGSVIVTLILLTSLSTPLWRADTILSRIQFPWRLMMVQSIAIAVLAGLAAHAVRDRRAWRIALICALPVGLAIADAGLFAGRILRSQQNGRIVPDNAEILAHRHDVNEYQLGDPDRMLARFGSRRLLVLSGRADARIVSWRPREIVLAVQASVPTTLAVRQTMFAGWRYRIDGGAMERARSLSPVEPVVTVSVPAGRHDLRATMERSLAERVGLWVSLFGWLIFGVTVLARWRHRGTDSPAAL